MRYLRLIFRYSKVEPSAECAQNSKIIGGFGERIIFLVVHVASGWEIVGCGNV